MTSRAHTGDLPHSIERPSLLSVHDAGAPLTRLGVTAAWALAPLLTVISVGGILSPAIYQRETMSWAAQAIGQDWVDLLFAVPWLVAAVAYARGGSRSARLLLAGGVLYAAYELVIYAFAVRFNALFLVYCAALGLSLFSFVALMAALLKHDLRTWFTDRLPVKAAGALLIAIGALFSALWLAEIIPALAHGIVPPSVAEARVPTSAVHVMDLSVVLPAHIAAGVLLLRRRRLGYVLAPVLLGFGVLMALSIAGMMIVMRVRGVPASVSVAAAMVALAIASAWVLMRMVRTLR